MKGIKIAAVVLGATAVFIAGVLTENYIRSLAREPIPVVISDNLTVKVEAHVQPDFLWAGKAWWIKITTRVPVRLDIDGEWEATIPPGTNTVYSNHDVNNTTEFNTNRWWKTPSRITVSIPNTSLHGSTESRASASSSAP
jgi:hypothetical protein